MLFSRLLEYIGHESDSKKLFEILLCVNAGVFSSYIGHAGFPDANHSFSKRKWRISYSWICRAELSKGIQPLSFTHYSIHQGLATPPEKKFGFDDFFFS